MEFTFDISRTLAGEITVFNGGENCSDLDKEAELRTIVDNMGIKSAKAQGLKGPITTYSKIIQSKDQDIYVLRKNKSVVGFIKTGRRRLFLWDSSGLIHEVLPVCILDFYVHESQQRRGYGKILFEQVLQRERIQPFEVAIDRPSSKFLSFLRKHYNLHSFIKQNNNYVVFKNFFSTCVHYDHGYSNRRQSLPNQVGVVSDNTTVSFKHRASLSPKWSYTSNNEIKSSLNSPLSTKVASPNTSFTASDKPATDILTSTSVNMINDCKPANLEDISWSEQIKPIPGSKHAPFLTLRSQPKQTTTFHSIFDQQDTTKFKGTDVNKDARYSRYHDTSSHMMSSRPSAMSYSSGFYDLNHERKQFKKHLWKEHFH